jgi:hypothetical protein
MALLILAIRWKQRTLLRTFWIVAGASTLRQDHDLNPSLTRCA